MSRTSLARRAAFITPLLCCLAALPLLVPVNSVAATQGSGNAVTETRTVGEFQAVSMNGSIDLVVRQGAQQSVQVRGDDNLLPLLETVVEPGRDGATLRVRWKPGESLQHRNRVQVTVVVPKLTSLATAGAGDIKLEAFQTPVLKVSISGSGNASLDALSTDELGIRVSGSGDVGGKGSAGKVTVSIAGSGDVRLMDLRADDVTVSIAGSGDAAVNAQKSLAVTIAGSGDVTYTGDATVKSSVAGSGSVRKK